MSTDRGEPPDVASLIENRLRKKLTCPECGSNFAGDLKLWNHAKAHHGEILGTWASKAEEEAIKSQFLDRIPRPQKETKPTQLNREPPKTEDEEDKGNVRSTLPGETKETAYQKIDTKPSEQDDRSHLDFHRTASSSNPLKRERGHGSDLQDSGTTRPAQSVEPSLGKLSRGEGFEEERKEVNEFKRSPAGKQLFDPSLDVASPRTKPRVQAGGGGGHRHSKEPRTRTRRQALSDGAGDRNITRPLLSDRNPSGSKMLPPGQQQQPPTILKPSRDSGSSSVPRNQSPKSGKMPVDGHQEDDIEPIEMLRQPETRSISHEQLVVEVKGIYAGLIMVEAKCIDVDEKQSRSALETSRKEPLKNEQWQSLIALHKQLLHEHHDFFLASQHPAASFNLSRLAAKYSMPARMWRHGIHAFLEVLRHRLPESLEHMLAFIYIAYSMMALLFETVPAFEDTWIECLGDLGRYRMAIEDDEPKDREVWAGVARFWYSKASAKNPTVGRLYHHLAILAKPFTLEQLSFYTRSLTCIAPFESARGSILTLFNPILNGRETSYYKFSSMEPLVIKLHGLMFLYPKTTKEEEIARAFAPLKANDGAIIHEAIDKFGIRFKRVGVNLAVSNISALLEFGALTSKGTHRSALRLALLGQKANTIETTGTTTSTEVHVSSNIKSEAVQTEGKEEEREKEQKDRNSLLTAEEIETSQVIRSYAAQITFLTFRIALAKTYWARHHTLPMIFVYFIFIRSISVIPSVIDALEEEIPWAAMCLYLNHLKSGSGWKHKAWNRAVFPSPNGISGRPSPELYIIQGQVYSQHILPKSLFEDAKVDDEERMLDIPSQDPYRIQVVLWIAAHIASMNRWIKFDQKTEKFVEIRLDGKDIPVDDAPQQSLQSSLLKVEPIDGDFPMEDVPAATVSKDEDAMSDVIQAEKTIVKRDTVLSDTTDENSHIPSSSTTRTNTDQTDFTNVTDASTVHQGPPETPKTYRMEVDDEPEEPPMRDISPGKDLSEPTLMKIGSPLQLSSSPPVFDPGSSPPRKANTEEYGSDQNHSIRIVGEHEDPEEG